MTESLSYDDALVEARQHLFSRRPPVEWVWRLRHGQRVDDGWFFWYLVEPIRFIRDLPHSPFGGAPGFIIMDDRQIQIVGWHQLPEGIIRFTEPPASS